MDGCGDGAGRATGHVWRLAMSDFEGSETMRGTWFFHFYLFFLCSSKYSISWRLGFVLSNLLKGFIM